MGIVIIRSYEEFREMREPGKGFQVFKTQEQVQYEFCSKIEHELYYDTPFLTDEKLVDFLKGFDIEYTGKYTFKSPEWGDKEAFVTFLNPRLQLGCIALFRPQSDIVLESASLIESKYLAPVLRGRDIYVLIEDFLELSFSEFREAIKEGIEIKVDGKSSKDMTEEEMLDFLRELTYRDTTLSRELDAKVFPKNYKEAVLKEPRFFRLEDYVASLGKESQERYEEVIEINPMFKDTTIIVCEEAFGAFYRSYPIHSLLEVNGEWKYAASNSFKNPSYFDLIEDAVLRPCVLEREDGEEVKATKIFSLILDCNGVCRADRYWEHVAMLVKYDKEKNEIEICEKNKAILEFHELLQQSTDLEEE